jgi:DNA (cytosine-5)-methyltransferase 1
VHYYNEIDRTAVSWLRNLIGAGLLPEGDVDDRSIKDVQASDLAPYTQCHWFAGIGGWPLALGLAGWPTTEPVWSGSCPCQPFSTAGRGSGTDDPRHLWPEFQRLIEECRPPIVFGEQVASKAGRAWLAGVRTDLEELGYGVGAADLCAASIGAPHIRQRLYWVADAGGNQHRGRDPLRDAQGEPPGPERTHEAGSGRGESPTRFWSEREPSDDRPGDSGVGNPSIERLSLGEGQQAPMGEPGSLSQPQRPSGIRSGVAHAQRSGLMDATPRNGEHDAEGRPQWDAPLNQREPSQGRSDEGGVAHANGYRTEWNQPQHRAGGGVKPNSTTSGVDNAPGDGAGRKLSAIAGGNREDNRLSWAAGSSDPWADSISIPCLDGKERRIEPRILPLANGVPGRVGQLRAYGNAIVPQVAAEFIMAYLEDVSDGHR